VLGLFGFLRARPAEGGIRSVANFLVTGGVFFNAGFLCQIMCVVVLHSRTDAVHDSSLSRGCSTAVPNGMDVANI